MIENEGVRFVRGRTLVGSRVIGAAGMALANSQTAERLEISDEQWFHYRDSERPRRCAVNAVVAI